MPFAPRSKCQYPRCPEYKPCKVHNRTRDYRPNASARGYDSTWHKFRNSFLAAHPLCVGSAEGCTDQDPAPNTVHFQAAVEVHHVRKVSEHPELRLVESNCLPQCRSCHNIRTKRGE
jgi:5-methylcytosine-specific restriction enzyme A